MINLVSSHVKKSMLWEYWVRVITVWCLLLFAALIAVSALLVPTFVLLNLQAEVFSQNILENSGSEKGISEAEKIIQESNVLAEQLMPASEIQKYGEILSALQNAKISGIMISSFIMSKTDEVVTEVQIKGTAVSRESLASFRTSVEENPLFKTAFIPISGLAKEKDLMFDIAITMADYAVK